MTLKVLNTLTGKTEEFKPIEDNTVRMYVCGPTVYDLSHIGHARSAVSFDVIYRYLRYKGYNVIYVKNYTDIDDKIINRATRDKVDWKIIAERYTKAYDEDMGMLGVESPTHTPKATETIKEIIGCINKLLGKNYAYEIDGDVYYSVRKFNGYGRLSGKNIEELKSGARVEVDERKTDPLDFALWKKSKPNEPWWESPWGKGRPGWHIECSAMCMKFLGETIDIHGGGKDLIFPHHENELAQSQAATGKTPFVKYWLHNGFVNIEKEKMSKSLGNILTIREALKTHTPESVRLFLLSSHYRSPIDYTEDSLKENEAKAERFYKTLERIEREWRDISNKTPDDGAKKQKLESYLDAMDNDFNTAALVGWILRDINELNRLMDKKDVKQLSVTIPLGISVIKEVGRFLGVFDKTPAEYFKMIRVRKELPTEGEISEMIEKRREARELKDYKKADAIRDGLLKKNIILEDMTDGTRWRVK